MTRHTPSPAGPTLITLEQPLTDVLRGSIHRLELVFYLLLVVLGLLWFLAHGKLDAAVSLFAIPSLYLGYLFLKRYPLWFSLIFTSGGIVGILLPGDIIRLLVYALYTGDVPVHFAFAGVQCKRQPTTQTLISLLGSPPWYLQPHLHDYAIEQLRSAGPAARDDLLTALQHEDPDVRADALDLLAEIKDDPRVLNALVEKHRDSDERVRSAAERALTKFRDPS